MRIARKQTEVENNSHTGGIRSVDIGMNNNEAKELLLGAATALESEMTTGWAPGPVAKLRRLARILDEWMLPELDNTKRVVDEALSQQYFSGLTSERLFDALWERMEGRVPIETDPEMSAILAEIAERLHLEK
jgi:hypothetical protein